MQEVAVKQAEPVFPPALSRYTPCPTLNALRRLWLLEVKFMLPQAHERLLSSSHSRPIAATINTTTTLNGFDEAGSSFGVEDVGIVGGAFFGGRGIRTP